MKLGQNDPKNDEEKASSVIEHVDEFHHDVRKGEVNDENEKRIERDPVVNSTGSNLVFRRRFLLKIDK
jgi:hypothetical protein